MYSEGLAGMVLKAWSERKLNRPETAVAFAALIRLECAPETWLKVAAEVEAHLRQALGELSGTKRQHLAEFMSRTVGELSGAELALTA
jgi:hypothetical protein